MGVARLAERLEGSHQRRSLRAGKRRQRVGASWNQTMRAATHLKAVDGGADSPALQSGKQGLPRGDPGDCSEAGIQRHSAERRKDLRWVPRRRLRCRTAKRECASSILRWLRSWKGPISRQL